MENGPGHLSLLVQSKKRKIFQLNIQQGKSVPCLFGSKRLYRKQKSTYIHLYVSFLKKKKKKGGKGKKKIYSPGVTRILLALLLSLLQNPIFIL